VVLSVLSSWLLSRCRRCCHKDIEKGKKREARGGRQHSVQEEVEKRGAADSRGDGEDRCPACFSSLIC